MMGYAAAAAPHVDEVRMESLIASEIKAVKSVLVVGADSSYLACLLTLKTLPGTETLDAQGREFASHHGSHARSVDEARQCDHFRAGLLKGFAAANKLVYESNKKLGVSNKAKQLRRFTIVPDIKPSIENPDCASSPSDCTLADRKLLLQQYAGAIASMYDAVETSDKSLSSKGMHLVDGRGVKGCESNEFARTSLFPASESTCERSSALNFTCAVPAPAPHFMTAAEDSSVSQDDTRQASGGIQEEAPIYGASNYVLASPASSSQVSPIKEGNRAKASNLVLSREAKAPLSRRIASSITAILPCFGMHSQVLDDDILNPGHTVAKRRKSPGKQKQANKKQVPVVEPAIKCDAKTVLVPGSHAAVVGEGSAGAASNRRGAQEDVSAALALQRAEMISQHLPPPPCFKPQANYAIDLYSSQSCMPHPGDFSAHRMLHIDGAGRGNIHPIGYTQNTLGSGCAGGSYLTPYANANMDSAPCASHVPLHALSLREETGQDNEHASPPQGCGDEYNSAAMRAHGGRAPTSDRLWEHVELAGLSSSQITGLRMQAPSYFMSGLDEQDFDDDPHQMDI